MQVRLMLTCLCDAFFGEVGIATVRVLEAIGREVEFPEDQTCCGQPPFNAGDWKESRRVAEHWRRVFAGDTVVVTPSSSCTAMIRHGLHLMDPDGLQPPPTFELAEFLVSQGIESWPPSGRGLPGMRFAYHCACHGRAIGLGDAPERLLRSISCVEVVPIEQAEQCCGFGGAFSASHGSISSGIGMEKLRCVMETGVDLLVSGDMGCLMHLNGLIERHKLPLRTKHYAEVLAEALDA